MSFQISGHTGRGTRVNQPGNRESRKQRRKPPATVRMLDGRHLTVSTFSAMCGESRTLLGPRVNGCAAYIASFVPGWEWKPVAKWIARQQSRLGGIQEHASEDNLVALLVCHATGAKQMPEDVLASIVRDGTVNVFFNYN